jgi:hypothetical protein
MRLLLCVFFHFLYHQFAFAYDLVAAVVEKTDLAEGLFVDHGASFEAVVEITDVDGAHDITEVEVVEAALGKATVKGHLAAFESDAGPAAGTGLLTLVAFTSGLAMAGAFAAAEALDIALGTRIGVVVVKLHEKYLV